MYAILNYVKPRKHFESVMMSINLASKVKLTMTLDEANDAIRPDRYYLRYESDSLSGSFLWDIKDRKTRTATVVAVALAMRRSVG